MTTMRARRGLLRHREAASIGAGGAHRATPARFPHYLTRRRHMATEERTRPSEAEAVPGRVVPGTQRRERYPQQAPAGERQVGKAGEGVEALALTVHHLGDQLAGQVGAGDAVA